MKELYNYISSLGWYTGEIRLNITLLCSFEGYYGRASETWEHQYHATCNEIKLDSGKIFIPVIDMKSNRYENIDDFAKRILKLIQSHK